MAGNFSDNITKPAHWLRILFMAGFTIALYVTGIVLLALIIAQALFSLLTGSDNRNLRGLGASLTAYFRDTLLYLTYNSDHRPFPFAPFPSMYDVSTEGTRSREEPQVEPGTPQRGRADSRPSSAAMTTATARARSAGDRVADPAAESTTWEVSTKWRSPTESWRPRQPAALRDERDRLGRDPRKRGESS